MNKPIDFATDYPMTFNFAISTLETAFDATYTGTKTVRDMCTSLTDAISWENESPDKVYHQFKSNNDSPNRIVSDDQLMQVANHYA